MDGWCVWWCSTYKARQLQKDIQQGFHLCFRKSTLPMLLLQSTFLSFVRVEQQQQQQQAKRHDDDEHAAVTTCVACGFTSRHVLTCAVRAPSAAQINDDAHLVLQLLYGFREQPKHLSNVAKLRRQKFGSAGRLRPTFECLLSCFEQVLCRRSINQPANTPEKRKKKKMEECPQSSPASESLGMNRHSACWGAPHGDHQ